MAITQRSYSIPGGDYQKVKQFFRENFAPFAANGVWKEERWEYMHVIKWFEYRFHFRIGLWEEDGRIVAVTTYENEPGKVFLFTAAGYEHLRPELLRYAEEMLPCTMEDGRKFLRVEAYSFDPAFQEFLRAHGYAEQNRYDYKAYDFAKGIPEPRLPAGFELLALDSVPETDYKRVNDSIWQGFNHQGEGDLESFLSVAHVPDFRKGLTYTVRAANGDYCCYGSIWLNKANHYAYLEPLCTHPAYRKRGLARALLYTAMRRV